MAIVPQQNLFSWKEIESSSDLDLLDLVLSVLPDEDFMQALEARRGKGRNDYPIRPMWNALLAGVIFQHSSAAELIRELRRNRELLERCGFDPLLGADGAPTQAAFGRFLRLVVKHRQWVMKMFEKVVKELSRHLPDLGETVALDSKALRSFGRKVVDPKRADLSDGRRDLDGEIGVKTYKGRRKDGSLWEKVVSWFGYKVHLIADSKHEIPLTFTVTKANVSDVKEGERIVQEYVERQPDVAKRTGDLSADKAYDSGPFNTMLYDDYGIKPVIDTRVMWQEEPTRALDQDNVDHFIYDEKGQVSCVCPWSGDMREMAFMGFEKNRTALKYRCPAAAYDLQCVGRRICEAGKTVGPFGRIIRVPLDLDRRIFTPIARHTCKWRKAYNRRSAVERVFSRLDRVFKFEKHTIRGKAKMEMRVGLAFLVLASMALGRIKAGQAERMRSLVTPLPRAA